MNEGKKTLFRALIFFLSIQAGGVSFAQPASYFSATAESWNTVGECPAESSPGAVWSSSGGNPGGCIKGTDNSVGVWYWYGGGVSWKGDLSDYYGCNLLFDLKTNNAGWPVGSQYDVLIIRNDDSTLSYNASPNPGTSWESYSVPLSEGSWIVDGPLDVDDCPDLAGALATAADMIAYLSDVKKIRIRAEFGGLNTETNYADNIIIDCSTLLPVTLTSFNGHYVGNHTSRINWATATETNCDGFFIQKSTNGIAFDSVAFVPGNGTTTVSHNYEFFDDNFLTTTYYRLKQIDFDGEFEYSNVIAVSASGQAQNIVHVFPNPASDYLNLIYGDPSAVISITITDMLGQVVYYEYSDHNNDWVQKQIGLQQYRTGLYNLTIQTTGGSQTTVFEVIK